MSERTMQAQRAQDLANRREVAAFRLANAAAFAANMLTAEMHEPGRLSVRRDLWNALDEWRKLHGLPDGWPIDERLATPEPGGEGGTLESRAYDIAHWIAMEARVAESLGRSVAPIEIEGARRIVALASARPTPAASEDVRHRKELPDAI